VAAGFVPIAGACRWWPVQVAAIVGEMLRGDKDHAATLASLTGRVLWPLVAVALVGAWQRRGHGFAVSVLILTELMLFHYCSPVAAFAIFFCLWHTPEHMVSTSLGSRGHFQDRLLLLHLQQGIIPWLLSLSAVAVLFWYGHHTIEAYFGVLFITLSALAVPHMALAEARRRRENDASDRSKTRFVSQKAVACG